MPGPDPWPLAFTDGRWTGREGDHIRLVVHYPELVIRDKILCTEGRPELRGLWRGKLLGERPVSGSPRVEPSLKERDTIVPEPGEGAVPVSPLPCSRDQGCTGSYLGMRRLGIQGKPCQPGCLFHQGIDHLPHLADMELAFCGCLPCVAERHCRSKEREHHP